MVSASAVDGTGVMEITVTSTDPQEAEKIANTICEVLPDRIAEIIDGSSGRIVDYAVMPAASSSPGPSSYVSKGLLLGFLFSCALLILLELMDEQIRDEDNLLETYDLPILAVVPDLVHKTKATKGYYGYGATKVEEEKGT
jgi:capsular polysaccharide biosynthesis protein